MDFESAKARFNHTSLPKKVDHTAARDINETLFRKKAPIKCAHQYWGKVY